MGTGKHIEGRGREMGASIRDAGVWWCLMTCISFLTIPSLQSLFLPTYPSGACAIPDSRDPSVCMHLRRGVATGYRNVSEGADYY